MKPQEMSSQVKEIATRFLLKGQIQVATCYTGQDMKTGIEVLTRKKDVATTHSGSDLQKS